MTRKVTYSLGTVPKIQKEIKQLLRQKEFALAHGDNEEYLKSTVALVDNFSGTQDWPKTIQHANELLKYSKKMKDQEKELFMGDYELAIKFGNEWSELAQYLQQEDEHVDSLLELALAYIVKGENTGVTSNFTFAQQLLTRANNLLRLLKIPSDEKERIKGDLLVNLGITEKYMGNIDKKRIEESAVAYCNLALCYDLKREYEKALKFGLEDQRLRHEMNDRIEETKSMWENILRYEKLFQFQEAKNILKTYISMVKEDDAQDLLADANDKMEFLNHLLENMDKIKILSVRIDRTDQNKNARAKAGFLEERGMLKLECGMGKAAAQDFLMQKKICTDLRSSTEVIGKILLNLGSILLILGKSVLLDDKYPEAERYLTEGLKTFKGPTHEEIDIRFRLYEAMTASGFGSSRQPYENQLEKIVLLCQEIGNLQDEEMACMKLRELHLYYNLQDLVNIDDLRIKRIRNKLPLSSESQDSDIQEEIEYSNSMDEDFQLTKSPKRMKKEIPQSPVSAEETEMALASTKRRKIAGFEQVYDENEAIENMVADDPIQVSSQDSFISINIPKNKQKGTRRVRTISVDSSPAVSPETPRKANRAISPVSSETTTSSAILGNTRNLNRVVESSSSLEERSGKVPHKLQTIDSKLSHDEDLNEKFHQDFESAIESYNVQVINEATILGTPRERDSIECSEKQKVPKKPDSQGFDDDLDEPLVKPKRQLSGYTSSPRMNTPEDIPVVNFIPDKAVGESGKTGFSLEMRNSNTAPKTLEIVHDTAPRYQHVSETSSESRMQIPSSLDYSCSPDLQSNVPPRTDTRESIPGTEQTPPRKSKSFMSQSSPIKADSLPRTPRINRKAHTPDLHRTEFTPVQQYKPTKIRKIQVEYSTPKKSHSKFTIPYYNGPNGTPKTFKWLLEETRRRYIDRHDVPGKIEKLVNQEGEVMCSWDVIEHMIEENEKVRAI
ncbi:hypothetical protein HDV06_002827 [Boothiomyces sp. JEL0866]|nr:hypothetical protein HDV06_002827 [Boothiomyces sp. JEL0866]